MVKPTALAPRLTRVQLGLGSAVLPVGLLLVALGMRLANLDAYTGKFDEGIRVEQLLLMRAGFRPVREIFAAQGPLSLDIFYGPYLAFGQTLAAARSAVVLYSLLGLLTVYWVAGLVGGRLAAALAMVVLVLSPLFLKNSRLALLEVPALAPATLALGAALLFQRDGRRRWLVLSAVAFGGALLIKPMIVAAAVPIGLALLLRPRLQWFDLGLFGGVALVVVLAVVALYGAEQVWQQVVVYRAKAGQSSGWSLRENWSIMSQELRDEQLPIYVLAIVGGLALAVRHPRWGVPLASWPLASFGLLLVYTPLQFKHVVTLLPPLALVVGAATALVVQPPRSQVRVSLRRAWDLGPGTWDLGRWTALALAAWYLTSLPGVLRQDWLIMSATTESRIETYADEQRLVTQISGPDDFIIVDDPIVAYNGRRKVPPELVDPSSYRVRSGALSGAEVVAAAERYRVELLFLFSDGLRELRRFDEYVDQRYRAVKIYERQNAKDRALYLRDDADFAAVRAVLARDIDRPLRADFGGDLRLLGYNLARDEVRPGASTGLTLHWEALRPMPADYHVITHLRGPGGQPDLQSERGLGGGGEGTASWEAGRWVFRSQVLTVPPRAAAGDYWLSVALYDSRSRTSPPITAGDGAGSSEVTLGQVRVR